MVRINMMTIRAENGPGGCVVEMIMYGALHHSHSTTIMECAVHSHTYIRKITAMLWQTEVVTDVLSEFARKTSKQIPPNRR